MGKGKFYDKVVFRHVNFDRGDTMVDNLEKFLSQAIGHKYGLSANKLTRSKTLKKGDMGVDEKGE